jgi:hypothetical protein
MRDRGAGVRRAAEGQLGRRARLAAGPHHDAGAQVERRGAIVARQAIDRVGEAPRVGGVEAEPGGGMLGRHGTVDVGEPHARPDGQPDRPRAGAERHPVAGQADVDAVVAGQLRPREEQPAIDEQVARPGECQAPLDQELAAVGGGQLAPAAPELDAVQGIPGRVLAGRGAGLGQRVEQRRRRLVPRLGWGRQLRERVDVGRLVGPRGWHAMVGPARECQAGTFGLEGDGRLVAALEVGPRLERDRDGAGVGAGARRPVLDGDAVVPILRA